MNEHEKINYLELPAKDLDLAKSFFSSAFGWAFIDYGPDYSAFADAGLEGGFYRSNQNSCVEKGSVLIVFYSNNLDSTQSKVERAGGRIIKPLFSFPGGYRFHFTDPNGNEYAVWSEEKNN